jgi:hypothetical protein
VACFAVAFRTPRNTTSPRYAAVPRGSNLPPKR